MLTNAEGTKRKKIDLNLTAAGISNQHSATDSSKMLNTINVDKANQTTTDPVELFLKVINRNPCCSNDYIAISQDLSKGKFSEALNEKSKLTPQDILLKSISLYPEEAISYQKLGTTLPRGGSVVLCSA